MSSNSKSLIRDDSSTSSPSPSRVRANPRKKLPNSSNISQDLEQEVTEQKRLPLSCSSNKWTRNFISVSQRWHYPDSKIVLQQLRDSDSDSTKKWRWSWLQRLQLWSNHTTSLTSLSKSRLQSNTIPWSVAALFQIGGPDCWKQVSLDYCSFVMRPESRWISQKQTMSAERGRGSSQKSPCLFLYGPFAV